MTVPRMSGWLAVCTLTAATLTAQASPRPDTVRATCALDAPLPRQCALERLGTRLQQVTGSPEAFVYDPTVQRFRGTQSQRVIPATITYDVDSRDMRAEVVLVPAVIAPAPAASPASPASPVSARNSEVRPPITTTPASSASSTPSASSARTETVPPQQVKRTPKGKPLAPTMAASALATRDIAIAPLTSTRVVIGHAVPTPIVFGIRRLVGTDTLVLLPSKVTCHAARRSALTVVRTRIEPTGVVTCWVQLGVRADSIQPVTLHAEMRFQKRTTAGAAVIEPVRVPLVAVWSTDPSCNELTQRVTQELLARGRPVVRREDATRRVQLEHCEHLARLLPVRNRELSPTGFYVRGEASEPGHTDEFNAQFIGPFEFTITKAGADPMVEAVHEVVDRLLKYRGL